MNENISLILKILYIFQNQLYFQELYHILERVSPVKIDIESTYNGSDGYYSEKEKRIVCNFRFFRFISFI